MPDGQEIPDNEIILRRIPPNPDLIVNVPGYGLRAASGALKPSPRDKKERSGPSFSRLGLTSPRQLLDQLRSQRIAGEGWSICWLMVGEVRAIGLDVIADPTDADAGHCTIRETAAQKFTHGVWTRLARRTRVLAPEQIENVTRADQLV